MKKVMIAATTLAAMTVAPFALADGTPSPASTTTTSTTTQAPAPVAAQPIQTMQAQPVPVSTTTLTSSDDVTALPTPVESTTQKNETITLKQTFHPNRPLLFTGAGILVGTYATTAALTASKMGDGENGDKTMYIPVVGPWLHLADVKETGTDLGLTVGSGILQGVGAVMAITSLFVPEKVPAATIQAGNVKMNVLPGAAYGTF